MSDRFGAMTLPATAGALDPALDNLLAFGKAVLIAQVRAAWARTLDTTPVVRSISACVPAEGGGIALFTEQTLPALFAWRPKGTFEDLGVGFVRQESEVYLAWVFPTQNPEKRARFDAVSGALAKVLASALSDGRHSSWTHDSDKAVAQDILLATPAPAVDAIYENADLTGAVGNAPFPAARRVLITTTVGTWDTSLPILVEGELDDGTAWTESVFLTNAAGGESVETAWIFSRVTRVSVPGQGVSTGTLAIGRSAASAVEYGSLIAEHMGASNVQCSGWQREAIRIIVADAPPRVFDAVLFRIVLQETRDRTPDAMGYPTLDSAAGGLSNFSQIVSLGGLTVETENE